MTNFIDLQKSVLQWARDRQIIPNAKPAVQLMKTGSELGELFDAEIKGDRPEIVDGIGDVLVTLIIYAELRDLDFDKPESDGTARMPADALMSVGIRYGLMLDAHKNGSTWHCTFALRQLLEGVRNYADSVSLGLEECLAAAYDEIKDRRGTLLPNGVFVKESA